ncbi:19982_t:CDS:2 [Funneliformis geosporum]|uniref:19982_t:CDS:1 n=1 Tax=Funneliformis geosporum TaxID=1117311 RepID=A0A9W4SXP3_9GLOM|nr:19982_t:CDS:2 [Funneliformis geosporum]
MITHDRYLINQTANYISELSPETYNLIHFRGNYRNYLQEKERQYQRLKQIREQQEKEIKFINRKLINLHIKKSAYVVDKVKRRENKMGFDARGGRNQKSYKRIVNQLKTKKTNLAENLAENISKSYGDKILFKNFSLELKPGVKLVIRGSNGSGKSTLLKIVMGIISADEGKVVISEQIKLGYLDQEQEAINLNQTIIELLENDPLIKLEKEEIIQKLEEFGTFYPQELRLPLSQLSIGCRRKAQLIQIILQGANALILDEPTNHIDLLSLEKIENQLINFPVLMVEISRLHIPVMLSEALDHLGTKKNGIYVDCTFDKKTVQMIQNDKLFSSPRFYLIHDNFVNLEEHLKKLCLKEVDGFLFDLGLSSYQLAKEDRGFSYRLDSPLDMRINQENELKAEEVINNYSPEKLADIFYYYGEERKARLQRIASTQQLVGIVASCFPHKKNKHPARKVFQALRIFINEELENLSQALESAFKCLAVEGKIIVISYHSLEDRIVKQIFKKYNSLGKFQIITKKPLTPEQKEINENHKARSAKMRVIQKLRD